MQRNVYCCSLQFLLSGSPSRFLRQINSPQTPLIAFSVALNNNLTNLGVGQNIRFDTIIINEGNGFNIHHGTFTAPISGVYVLNAKIMGYLGHDKHFDFVQNGNNIIFRLYIGGSNGGNDDSTGGSIVLRLQKGDDVVIQNGNVGHGVYGLFYSFFSGFLLRSSETNEIIVG